MIPKTIHRIWVRGSPILPDAYARAEERWRELHPEWTIRTWTFPPFVMRNSDAWRDAPPGDALRWRADLLRLELLEVYGGVYVDMDVVPLRPFDSLIRGVTAFAGYSPDLYRGQRIVTNAILGAAPGHPWIKRAVRSVPDSVRAHRGKFTAMVVGPHHVTRALQGDPSVTVHDSGVLYPRTLKERVTAFSFHMWATRNGITEGLG